MEENCETVCSKEVAPVLSTETEVKFSLSDKKCLFANYSGISLKGVNKTFLGNVYVDGHPVCDDKWDLLDAHVVCYQLGLGPAIAATKRSFFGLAEGDYKIDNVECNGSENDILDCDLSVTPNCARNEVAGVICSSKNIYKLKYIDVFFFRS